MSLVTEIVSLLSSTDARLEDALLKTKVLLHRLGQGTLAEWVSKELNGYSNDDEVPNYRIIPSTVRVNATDGYTTRWNNLPAPTMHLDKKIRRWLEENEMRESISSLEELAGGKGQTLSRPIPPEFWGLIGEKLGDGIYVENASCETSKAQLVGVLTQIRSRLLDFVLKLEEKLPEGATDSQLQDVSKSVEVSNLLNNAMFGPNTTIVIGDSNKQSINFMSIQIGNFDSLAKHLASRGVEADDLHALKAAIEGDSDSENLKKNKFGPAVTAWLKTMIGKAADMTWDIELGAAGSLLAAALNSYYGWF